MTYIKNLTSGDIFLADNGTTLYIVESVTVSAAVTRVNYRLVSDVNVRNTFSRPSLSTVKVLAV